MQRISSLLIVGLITIGIVSLAGWSRAQPNAGVSPPKSGTRLITLGTRAGPLPAIGRAQSSNLLIVNGSLYLIDAGPGVTRRLTRAGISVRDIDNIFLSHDHSDHTDGLAELLSAEYAMSRAKPINIYGPPPTGRMVDAAAQLLTVDSEIRMSDGTKSFPIAQLLIGHDVGTGLILQDANVKISTAENTHFHFPVGSPAYGKAKSYSYRFETPGRVVVFTGDTGPSDAVTELAKGADLLVSEITSVDEVIEARKKAGLWDKMSPANQAGFVRHMKEEHLIPEEVAKMAARAGVKTVVLTHLADTADPKDDYKRFADQVKKNYSGPVLVAKDLMEF